MELTDIQPTTDLTADSILTTTDQSGADDVTSFVAGKERDISVSGATFEDKRLAFGDSFKQVNGVVGLYDWFNSDMTADMESIFDTKDPLFVDQWNETNKLEYLEQQGFGIEQYSRISQAGSAESLQLITDGINKDITRQTNISENLSQGWQTAGVLAGSLLDADLAIPFAKINKAKTILQMTATPIMLQTAWESARLMTDDDYTLADATLSVGINAAMLGVVTKYQLDKLNKITPEYSNTVVTGDAVTIPTKSTETSNWKFTQTPPKGSKTIGEVVEENIEKVIKNKDYDAPPKEPSNSKIDVAEVKMYQDIMTEPKAKISGLMDEVMNILENAKLDGINPNSSKLVEDVNDLMKVIKAESGDDFLVMDDIVQMKMTKNADGSYSMTTPKGKKFGKAVPATVAVALVGGSTLQAEGFEDATFSDAASALMAAGILFVGGTSAYKRWKKAGGSISDLVSRTKANLSRAKQSVDIASKNKAVKNVSETGTAFRTRLTETYARFAKVGGIAKEMADKLLVNFANGSTHSAEIMKRRFARNAETAVAKVEDEQFVKWTKGKINPVTNFVENNQKLDEFREQIADAIDGGDGTKIISPEAQTVAKEFKVQMKMLYDEMVAADVKGYSPVMGKDGEMYTAIKYTEDYIPRYWKSSSMRQMIAAGADNRNAIHKAIAEMNHSAAMKKYHKAVEEWNMTGREGKQPVEPTVEASQTNATSIMKAAEGESVGKRGRVNDNSMARLEAQMEADGITVTPEMRKALEMEADKTSNAMYKVQLDYTAFKPFKAMIDGKEIEITLGHLIDRDSHSIMSRYANEQGGNIALGKSGYRTVNAARLEASKIEDLELREDMNMVIDSIAGEDMVGMTNRQKQRYEVMTGIAFIAKLPLVTVSMLTEYAKILTTKSGFHSMMNQISEGIFKTYPKQSMFMDELVNASGQGTASLRHEVNLKGLGDVSNIQEASESAFTGTAGMISDTVRQGKEAASRYYGLLKFSDFLQKHALATNSQVLSEMIHKGRKMSPKRMQQYGITEDILKDFQSSGLLKAGDDGWVSKLDYDKFTPVQKDEWNNIMFRMNQNLTQETTLGGSALYMHNDYMFKSLSYLLTFPAEAFANHGIRDATTMDNEAFRSMFAMYLGGYMSLKLRYAIEEKEVTDEEVAYRALIGLPIFGALSVANGITDPVVLSFFQNKAELIKLSKYEDKVIGD